MATHSIYQKIVIKLLGKMKHGKLCLILPGEKMFFGEGTELNAEIKVLDQSFFKKVVLYGDIGFGEAYMEKLWDTPDLTKVVSWMIINMNNLPGMSGSQKAFNPINFLKFYNRISHMLKQNSRKGSQKNISEHYDLNNDFFQLFLDPSMTYSSALFKDESQELEQAQIAKYDSLCRMMKISHKDHVLEIGCGWGGFAVFAAQNYGCKVTAITISEKQYSYAKQRIESENMGSQVQILLRDYRLLEGQFHKVVSIEMIEAVGHKYFKQFFSKINNLLKKDGVLGLQAITIPDNRYKEYRKSVDWIQKHIFPGGLLPSIGIINKTVNLTGNLNLYHLKDMGLSYSTTLKMWFENFESNIGKVRELGFNDQFIRKWEYYLCLCEAAFKQRNINVVQIVYAKPNNPKF